MPADLTCVDGPEGGGLILLGAGAAALGLPRALESSGKIVAVVFAVAAMLALIVAQSLLSRLWLAHFVYGPLEWLWRSATWLRPVAFRRAASSVTVG